MPDPGQQVLADRRVRLQRPMIRHRQAVGGRQAKLQSHHPAHDERCHLPGHPRKEVLGLRQAGDGRAAEPLGKDPRAAADHQEHACRQRAAAEFRRDVDGTVAEPDDDHALAAQVHRILRIAVGMRVHLRAVEVAGRHRIGALRVPVVAVGDDQRVEQLDLAVAERHLPAAIVHPAALRDLGAEPDVPGEAEPLDIGLEILMDLAMARIGGQVGRHREVLVLHQVRVGVDVQRVVSRAGALRLVVDAPESTDVRRALKAHDRDAAVLQGLDDGQPARAGADDAGAGSRGGRSHLHGGNSGTKRRRRPSDGQS